MAGTTLQAVRHQLGYKAEYVIAAITDLARARNIPIMSASSLKTKLSRWENGRDAVSEPYRRLFREFYGRTSEELGFPPELVDNDTEELRARLAVARTIDAATVELFGQQIEHARRVDRKFGGLTQLDALRSQITQLELLLDFSTTNGHREALAATLAETAALAGWQALDRNALDQAWRLHQTAKAAARAAESPQLLAHATAQQAYVLIDLGEEAAAVEQLAAARTTAEHTAAPLLRAWLAAAHGEGLAILGRRVR